MLYRWFELISNLLTTGMVLICFHQLLKGQCLHDITRDLLGAMVGAWSMAWNPTTGAWCPSAPPRFPCRAVLGAQRPVLHVLGGRTIELVVGPSPDHRHVMCDNDQDESRWFNSDLDVFFSQWFTMIHNDS